jgi:Tol biopolymer transport system component
MHRLLTQRPQRRTSVIESAGRVASVALVAAGCVVWAAPAYAAPGQIVAAVEAVAGSISEARSPSISGDGRYVVFQGTVAGRRSVFRTDRQEDVTIELSPVPPGIRAGDTVRPTLSADGCVVAAITEIPFDLFRDDDRGERRDVYRLVVPECGGQPNAWQLVSVSDRTGVARDDVSADSTPALSGVGGLVAYVHQAPTAPDGVGTVSVVDMTKPIGEPGSVQQVAGMPAEAPSGAFKYRGARDPVLSQNGRHLAFVSDTTASSALPGWGDGPVPGEYATSQVFVWDRGASDQRRAVRLVSGRDGAPSNAGADQPAMSEDGRIVVFASRDRTLVPAQLSHCTPDCPSQIYRFDRDPDRNGIFDEPPRRPQLAIVSAVDAGVVDVGLPVAGDEGSWSPAVNADGTEVAFVTDATNLLPSRRGGGGASDDGDLLVAETELGSIRRVLDGADTTGVPGAHGHPALSRTGQVIAFDTMAAAALPEAIGVTSGADRTIVAVTVSPHLSLPALEFGTVLQGLESSELYAEVRNAGPAAFEPISVESSSSNFSITGGTCLRGIIVAAGSSCRVRLTFTPTEPRAYTARVTVSGGGPAPSSVSTEMRGAAGNPALLADPGGVDLPDGIVGEPAGRVAIDILNIGFLPTTVADLVITGANPNDFHILLESCTKRALNTDASCTVAVEFVPTDSGYRNALLVATSAPIPPETGRPYTAAVLGGFARYEPLFRGVDARVELGRQFPVGGQGFPPNAVISIGFDDGGDPFATAETGPDGRFLAVLTMPVRARPGLRALVASGPAGVAARWPVEVAGLATRPTPAVPGFGLG